MNRVYLIESPIGYMGTTHVFSIMISGPYRFRFLGHRTYQLLTDANSYNLVVNELEARNNARQRYIAQERNVNI